MSFGILSSAALLLLASATLAVIVRRSFEAQKRLLASAEQKLQIALDGRLLLLAELSASIAHDINQPLTAIVTNGSFCLRLLDGRTPDPEALRQAIAEMVDDGIRASTMIAKIRSHLMTRSQGQERLEFDVNDLIEEVALLFQSDLLRCHISLRAELADDLPGVWGDRTQLRQALMNLVTNSIEAMQSPKNTVKELILRSARTPDGVRIEVQDCGSGIDSQIAEHIFSPFFTTKADATGTGLAISRSVAESHGGRLWTLPTTEGACFALSMSIGAKDS